MKAKYIGTIELQLGDGKVIRPGDIVEIADHEIERVDFEPVSEKKGGKIDA